MTGVQTCALPICFPVTILPDVVLPEIKRLFPAKSYSLDKLGGQIDRAIHFDNGWEMRFFTMDVGVDQMESASVGLVVIDEPASEDIWKAVKSRARMGCLTILPMTPLNVEPYVLDEIERNKHTGLYARITSSIYDACEERGVRGHLEKEIIDEMVAKYPADEVIARAYGEFMYFREKIWTGVDPRIHFVNPDDYPVDMVRDFIVQVVDPHDSRPSACFYGALQPIQHSEEYKQQIRAGKAKPQVRRVIFMETPLENENPYWEMYRSIRLDEEPLMWAQLEDQLGIKTVNKRIIDKRYGFQTKLSKNIAAVYAEAGRALDQNFHANKRFVYLPSYDMKSTDSDGRGEIAFGHNLVNKAFDLLEDGKPGLVIWNTCVHTINGVTHYVRKRLNNRNSNDIAVGESKIVEKYKDFNDLLRYFVAVQPTIDYIDYKRDEPVRDANRNTRPIDTGNKNIYKVVGSYLRKAR